MKVVEDRVIDGVRHRAFVVERDGHEIPGALWTPPGDDAGSVGGLPLALLGHGASGNRYQDYIRAVGRHLAGKTGIAAAAIDGPVHGARRSDGGKDGRRAFFDFAARWSSDESLTDSMIDDWRTTLDELTSLDEIGDRIGYWGLSMGTIFGLPLVAAEPRISVAVLGLMGITGPTQSRIADDAARVSCPVLFLVQWSDELFPRETAFALFDALGSSDKALHANPGNHGEVPDHEFDMSVHYLAERLTATRAECRLT